MPPKLPLATQMFLPGQRASVAVSGGADSVAMLRALHAERDALGLVLSVVHVHHGIRGRDADADAAFVRALSEGLGLPYTVFEADTPGYAAEQRETLEEAARHLRYGFFEQALTAGQADVVATAHTLDDQAETVMMKLLRGAWTEGLGGIYPIVPYPRGAVVRPLLAVPRSAIEAYLEALGQAWREDASNMDTAFTRNRVRHQLLPLLREYNPQIAGQLSRMAAIARDEEAWWAAEVARVLPQLLLPGRPARGGGRATSTHPEEASMAIEVERLRGLQPAMRRRVLRGAGLRLGLTLESENVERLLRLALGALHSDAFGVEPGTLPSEKRSGRQLLSLPGGWMAERTPRELRIIRSLPASPAAPAVEYSMPVPGSVMAAAYALRVTADGAAWPGEGLTVRAWRLGDRVTLRHSRGPEKSKGSARTAEGDGGGAVQLAGGGGPRGHRAAGRKCGVDARGSGRAGARTGFAGARAAGC